MLRCARNTLELLWLAEIKTDIRFSFLLNSTPLRCYYRLLLPAVNGRVRGPVR
jgi:hypothetical protein